MHAALPLDFNLVEYGVRFKMRLVMPPLGGYWLTYEMAIAALNEFEGLVSVWGAIEIPYFTVLCEMKEKAVLQVGFFKPTD